MSETIEATLYTDPACPWGYSALPALNVLEWRYGSQLRWRLVLIGLSEDTRRYAELGFTPLGFALGQLAFRRYGMPFALQPKERLSATARACRAVVAARLDRPGEEWRVLRAPELANLTTPLLLDDDEGLARALAGLSGCDAHALISRLDDDDVTEAYERDRAEARRAAGSAAELQGKTATDGDQVRFTAPSLVFRRGAKRLVAGGFQPLEAYDVLVANLEPGLRREPVPETVAPLLARFPDGLTTQEVAALMARGNDAPDRQAAEKALLELVGSGAASRLPLGDDALWQTRPAPAASARFAAAEPVGAAAPALALIASAEAASCSTEAACL